MNFINPILLKIFYEYRRDVACNVCTEKIILNVRVDTLRATSLRETIILNVSVETLHAGDVACNVSTRKNNSECKRRDVACNVSTNVMGVFYNL